ncbi:hypothetical protein HanRHA438_Chr06g0267901 [Helianthus annuus]|uniref:Uncharacterized protein n=1 Tax=Helianthus annuus TaxID=4232 RepID=A0A9K3NK10_HELAN|nr:hypothetical protein HanXRQr2_Chr06g0258771 [Helianthus annuus]KAJ0911865.1 hypothetical protein HanRHA438_Chr06g0267901 [Helianthus annuus]KAJ0915435.1 hypothetical protein HanPSC8_Chr06g0249801 [Helianthus annuus]
MRVRWSAIESGSPETFSRFLALSLFLRKCSGSSRGSFMSLLELELIHYVESPDVAPGFQVLQ